MILLLIPLLAFLLWYWRADKSAWSHRRAVGAFFLSLAAAYLVAVLLVGALWQVPQ